MSFSSQRYARLINRVRNATSSTEKGSALEDLFEYLMNLIPGVRVIARDPRCEVEEIDLILWNSQTHPFLKPWDSIILVECKNWQTPVGSQEIAWFLTKMRRRGITNGIFVAMNGVTGDFDSDATRLLVEALSEKIRVIVITNEDLSTINGKSVLCKMLRDKYCLLFLGKIIGF